MQVYADNAATTRMSDKAVAAMTPYFQQFYGNPSSLHTVGQQAAEALADARRRVADCLGCSFKEITFTSGGSEADNQAIVSAARIGERKGKKHIISTAFEHHAVLHTLKKLEKEGFEVTLLDVGPTGTITPQQVAEAIRKDTCLILAVAAKIIRSAIRQHIFFAIVASARKGCPKVSTVFATHHLRNVGGGQSLDNVHRCVSIVVA